MGIMRKASFHPLRWALAVLILLAWSVLISNSDVQFHSMKTSAHFANVPHSHRPLLVHAKAQNLLPHMGENSLKSDKLSARNTKLDDESDKQAKERYTRYWNSRSDGERNADATFQPAFPLFPVLLNDVFVTDIVWIPDEFRFVVLALNPAYFHNKTNDEGDYKRRDEAEAFNHTFAWESLKHPANIKWWIDENSSVDCDSSITHTGDGNVDDVLFIASCSLPSVHSSHLIVGTGEQPVANLTLDVLNALHSFEFRREYSLTPDRGVSVCIYTFSMFSRYVLDMVKYFEAHGFAHVYLGIQLSVNPNLLTELRELLAGYLHFISFGVINSSDVTFTGRGSQKVPFMNSVLFHSKSFDQLLAVHDIDEVVVSADPSLSASETLLKEIPESSEYCYVSLSANSVPTGTETYPDGSLAENFPVRCEGGYTNYTKSVAIVKNVQFLGLHIHDSTCPLVAEEMKRSVATVLHFASFWQDREDPSPDCNIPIEFARPLLV